jgi:hypothetical protein
MGLIDALLDVVAGLIAPQWRRARGRHPKESWSVRRSRRRLEREALLRGDARR